MAEELSATEFANALKCCASLPKVRREVIANFEENRWWPACIDDNRLRMIIAGLGTRVSYSMIACYQRVISELSQIGYDQLCRTSEAALIRMLQPLGLARVRLAFCRSMMSFIAHFEREPEGLSRLTNDEFVELLATNVAGVGYKIAQCCVLYARGYNCGVIPVDLGMRDKLSLCIGVKVPRTPLGHEIMRKELERLVGETDCYSIAVSTGYGNLRLAKDRPLTWWAHLVLIYYKRLFCNKPAMECPLRMGDEALRGRCGLHHS